MKTMESLGRWLADVKMDDQPESLGRWLADVKMDDQPESLGRWLADVHSAAIEMRGRLTQVLAALG